MPLPPGEAGSPCVTVTGGRLLPILPPPSRILPLDPSRLPRPPGAARRLPLANPAALQHRHRCLRPLGRRRAEPHRDHRGLRRLAGDAGQLRPICATSRTGWRMRCARAASCRATASRSCCRRGAACSPPISPPTSSAPSRCPWRHCSASMRWPIGWAIPARRCWSRTPPGSPRPGRSPSRCPSWRCPISIDGADRDALGWDALLADASPDFTAVDTRPRRSGADDLHLRHHGNPKGALHGHRVLPGHLPGVQMPHEFMPQPGDLAWTPADWAWAGGLLNMLLPALHFGVAGRGAAR